MGVARVGGGDWVGGRGAAWQGFRRDGIRLAMTRDMGPDATLGSFSRRYETPKLRKRLAAEPPLYEAPYLNAGIVFFSDDALLPSWRPGAEELAGACSRAQTARHASPFRVGAGALGTGACGAGVP